MHFVTYTQSTLVYVMTELKYAEAVRAALRAELATDERVVVLGQEVGALGGVFTTTKGLQREFGPERVLDTPISEAAIAGWAVGAAMAGMRPVVEIMFMDFVMLAMDQIVNGAAKLRYMSNGQLSVPLVVRMPAGAGTRHGPQHSQQLESWFAHVPGLIVAMPSRAVDVYTMLRQAIRSDDPVVFVESKYLYFRESGEIDESVLPELPVTQTARVVREGTDLTVVTAGRMVQRVVEAARDLHESDGIACEIIDLRYLWPLDTGAIARSVARTSKLAVVHEAVQTFGWGGEIASWVAEYCLADLDGPIVRIGSQRAPVPFAEVLENAVVPTEALIKEKLRELATY